MPTRNVHLTEHQDRFIEQGVASGHFTDASDIVREALRLLEQRQQEDRARIEWLRAAAQEGFGAIESGDYTALNSTEDLTAFLQDIHREVSAELSAERNRA